MIHFLVAKLFFIIFSVCLVNINAEVTPVNISCIELGKERYLQLNSPNDSRLAIFCVHGKWYAVWDLGGPVPSLMLPKQDDWPAGFVAMEIVHNINVSRPCLILSLDISAEMLPIVTKTEKGWAINAVSEYLLKNDPNPLRLAFDHQGLGHFRILNAENALSIKLNMPTGEELSVIPTNHPDTGLDALEADYVDVYESLQGACLYLKSDQLFVEHQGKDLAYYPASDPILPSQKYLKECNDYPPEVTFIQPNDFTYALRASLAEKAIYDKKNRPLHLLKQAWIELALCEGEEAKQTILLLGKENPDFIHSLFYKLILGFAQFLSQDYQESLKTLEALPNKSEINLWRGLSKTQLDERFLFDADVVSILKNYPSNLRDYILVKIVPYLFESQQIKLLKAIQQEIVPQSAAQAVVAFYHAMCVFTQEDRDEGYKLLEPIAKNETGYSVPNRFQTEAQLEIYFYKNPDAALEEVIRELDILRTQSRGNDIEVKICLKLIEQLEKKKDYPKIIDLVQDLVQRFKKFDVSLGLNHLLKSYIEKFFIHDNDDVSPVKIIGLFRKYKAVIESHPAYDRIAEHVAYQYERLDLLDQAAHLLTEIYQRTLDEEKKTQLQMKVGNIHVKNSKPEEATNLLSKIYHTIAEKYKKEAAKILARADFMRKDHQASIKWLKYHPTKENKRIIVDIYISMEDYPHIIDSLKDYISSLKEKEDDDLIEQGLIELAAAYLIQKEFANLKALHDAHSKFMKGRKDDKTFTMLCRPRAEDLKTSDEVRDYINDADEIRKIFEKAKLSFD